MTVLRLSLFSQSPKYISKTLPGYLSSPGRLYFSTLSTVQDLTQVTLKFDSFQPKLSVDGGSAEPERLLIILHGLFGSKQNWTSLGKAFQASLATKNFTIHTLDLRNHGDSPHHHDMKYLSMANDIATFINNLPKSSSKRDIYLLGHSLGGRVAMTYALASVSKKSHIFPSLKKLIVVDVSPGQLNVKTQFENYIKVMQKIDEAKLKKQSEADLMLQESGIEKLPIRQFLLTNFKKVSGSDGIYQFRNPLSIINSHLDRLGQLDPIYTTGIRYPQPTLFVAGLRSSYIPESSHHEIRNLFPNSSISSIDAGHWVHSEKPKEFLETVCQFIKE